MQAPEHPCTNACTSIIPARLHCAHVSPARMRCCRISNTCVRYCISFFPKRVIAINNTKAAIATAQGTNGKSANPSPTFIDETACKEQDTKYPL